MQEKEFVLYRILTHKKKYIFFYLFIKFDWFYDQNLKNSCFLQSMDSNVKSMEMDSALF